VERPVSYGFLNRWSASSRSSIVRAAPLPERGLASGEIEGGLTVVDINGQDLGTTNGRLGDFLVVSRGLLRAALYVPVTAVKEVRRGKVTLSVTALTIAQLSWSKKPRSAAQRPG
jgi:hypothetical protein